MQGVSRRRHHGRRTGGTCPERAGVPQLGSNRMQLADQTEARAGVPPPGAQGPNWVATARNASLALLPEAVFHRRKAAVDHSPGNHLAPTLGQVIADLEHLNCHTEQDFLSIGGKLTEFIQAVKLISSELTALANWEHGLRASQALACALDSAKEMMGRAQEGNGLLGSIHQEAHRLKRTLAGFHEIVSTFRTLGVLTRIETARLGSASTGFGNLADDVK